MLKGWFDGMDITDLRYTYLEPSVFTSNNRHIVLIKMMTILGHVCTYGGRLLSVVNKSFSQPSFCLPYIGGQAIGAVNLLQQATSVHFVCFIFRGHKPVANGVHRFGVDLNPQLYDGPV